MVEPRLQTFKFAATLWAVLCLAIIGYYILGEKIPVNNGFGYDGEDYASYAERFAEFRFPKVDPYRIHRILPSAICGVTLRGLSVAPSPQAIISSFVMLSCASLVGSFYALAGICSSLKFSNRQSIACFIGVFLSYGALKFPSFYPVLTDFAATCLSLLAIHWWLRRRDLGVFLVTVLGAFTWPTLLLQGCVLLIFPPRVGLAIPRFVLRPAGLMGTVVLVTWFAYQTYQIYFLRSYQPTVLDGVRFSLVGVSAAFAYLALNMWTALSCARNEPLAPGVPMQDVRNVLLSTGVRLGFAAVLFISIGYVCHRLSVGTPSVQTQSFLRDILIFGSRRPFIFVISNTLFLGPFWLLLLISLRDFWRGSVALGAGAVILSGIAVLLALHSESRMLSPLWPLVVVILVSAVDRKWTESKTLTGFVISGLAVSQAWLPRGITVLDGTKSDFPAQWYFMNLGPWMGPSAYWLAGGTCLSILSWMLWVIYRKPSDIISNPSSTVEIFI